MPAFHDFRVFFDYAKKMASAAVSLEKSDRHICSSFIKSVFPLARLYVGKGRRLDTVLQDAIALRSDQLASGEEQALHSTTIALCEASKAIFTDGYGVMDIFSNGDACLRAFVCACIDDVVQPMWRDALREVFTNAKNVYPEKHTKQIHIATFALIACAVDAGNLLRFLHKVHKESDLDLYDELSMYGSYICSSCVSARDILRNSIETRSSKKLRNIAFHAIMWNLSALDARNGNSYCDYSWEKRLKHNLKPVGMIFDPCDVEFQNELKNAASSFRRESRDAHDYVRRLSRRRDKIYVTGLNWRRIAAWAYIIISIFFSSICAIQNWAQRENILDRFKDAVETASFLLITVFGLVKLTSEDPNVLKNLARGRAPVQDIMQASYFLSSSAIFRPSRPNIIAEYLQLFLAVNVNEVGWADAEGCCYGHKVVGKGLDAMPARVEVLKRSGFFFLEGICKRSHFWGESVRVEEANSDLGTLGEVSDFSHDFEFSTMPIYTRLA